MSEAQDSPAQAAKIEAWYSMNKGLAFLGVYALGLGGAVYFICMQLLGLGFPPFLVSIFALAFLYMLALQIRTFLTESRAKEPVFILTDRGVKLRPLEFQTIPWNDLSKIEIHNNRHKGNFFSRLFSRSGFLAFTIKPNAKLAPAIANWTKGKGRANEFFLSANMMATDINDLEAFVKQYAPQKIAEPGKK